MNNTANIVDIYPLSPMQQGLLFHSLAEPGAGLYVVQFHCLLRGKLDVAAFRQAWQRVIDRHAVLRSDFEWESADEPLQLISRHVHAPLEEYDWRHLPAAAQPLRLAHWLQEDRVRGFDLA